MGLHGRLGEVELCRKLGVGQAPTDQAEHFAFTVSEPVEPRVVLVRPPALGPLREQATNDGRCKERFAGTRSRGGAPSASACGSVTSSSAQRPGPRPCSTWRCYCPSSPSHRSSRQPPRVHGKKSRLASDGAVHRDGVPEDPPGNVTIRSVQPPRGAVGPRPP